MSTYDKNGIRVAPYAENSTKGNSVIQPLNYKGDVLTQAWVDSRVLATLSNWLIKSEFYPRSMSDVARRPLEVLCDYLVQTGQVEMVEETVIARECLSSRYRVNLNRGTRKDGAVRGGKNILHNQVLTDKRVELGEQLKQRQTVVDTRKPIIQEDSPVNVAKALEIYQAILAKESSNIANEAIEAMKAAGMVAPSEKPDVFQGMTLDEVNERQARIDEEVKVKENAPLNMDELLKGCVK
jgi:hypothetical protein